MIQAADDLHPVGTTATILQLLKLPDGTVKVLVEGSHRARVNTLEDRGDHYVAEIGVIEADDGNTSELEALMRAVIEQFESYAKLNRKIAPESVSTISEI